MQIGSLQTRIVVFFGVLMVAVQLLGLVLIHTVGLSNARSRIDAELETGERLFAHLVEQRNGQLTQAARVLSADYAFREALASHDSETIASALANHGDRIHAQLMMLVGLDRITIAHGSASDGASGPFPVPELIASAEKHGAAASIIVVGGRLYQAVVLPVASPLPVGWVVMGFIIDDEVAQELQRLSHLDVTFLSQAGDGAWTLQASTMPAALRGEIGTGMRDGRFDHGESTVGAIDYLSRVSKQTVAGGEPIVAVLQTSLDQALAPFRRLMRDLIVLSVIGTLVSIACSVAIARSIAQPLRLLAAFARRIAAGDYSKAPPIDRIDEIGDLSTAFDRMLDGIEAREGKITDLAYRDGLTGLPNRALFADRLQQCIAAASRQRTTFSILILDLDRFKYVNDTLGHHIGDMLLRQVAERISAVMKRQSDTVARLGGDEFAVLLPTCDVPSALLVAERILRSLDEPMTLDGHPVDVHASVGVASYPQHGEDLEGLMRRADVAMYCAKRTSAGAAVYDVASDQHSAERLTLMSELRRAVEDHQLVVHYQPKVNLAHPTERCVEALVRWQHPRRGFVPPSEFIPFAEQTGYIRQITLWVLERVTAQCAAWARDGMPVKVSVNISARDLLNAELPTRFAEMLERHGCRADAIWLEITESAILEDTAHVIANLERLSAQGCKLSIDDYGTGYSSLSYLKKLPVDELKIDRSFIMNMTTSHDDRVIVQSTIDLAHNMGLTVTAEGVEDQETLDRLRAMGCDMAQGYLMSKAISATDVTRWMRESTWLSRPEAAVRLVG